MEAKAILGAPAISVITATYAVGGVSRRRQLRRAYESLKGQRFLDWEWLVVGDGCADDTGRLVHTWSITDSRVSWSNLTPHTGHPSAPRNLALSAARGRYLAFLDDDTVMGSEKLQLLTHYLETHPEYQLVWGNRAIYNSEADYRVGRMAAICRDFRQGLDMGDAMVRNLGYRFTDLTSGCEDQAFFAQFKKPWGHVDALVNHYIWHGANRTGAQMIAEHSRTPNTPSDFSSLVRDIPGYSAVGVLELLNRYVRALPPGLRYAELGSFHGLTLVGALLGNTAHGVAIDNFSEFGGTEAALRATLDHYRLADRVDVLSMDFQTAFTEGFLPHQSVGVYFYDGPYQEETQYLSLKLVEPLLAPGAIVVVDDTNWPLARRATEQWIRERSLPILQDIRTDDFRTSPYWNGLIVCRWIQSDCHPQRESTLQCPVPLLQSRGEFAALLDLYRALEPRTVLEIGSLLGGTLWHWLRFAPPGALVVNIDALVSTHDTRYARQKAGHDGVWAQWASDFRVSLQSYAGYSTDPAILTQIRAIFSKTIGAAGTKATTDNLQPSLDFLFLDADHSYAAVKFDYLHYGPLVRPGGLIALHDILDRPTSQVAPLWREIVQSGARTRELVESPDQPEMGIGVVFI